MTSLIFPSKNCEPALLVPMFRAPSAASAVIDVFCEPDCDPSLNASNVFAESSYNNVIILCDALAEPKFSATPPPKNDVIFPSFI